MKMNKQVNKRDALFAMLSQQQQQELLVIQEALEKDPTCLDHQETIDED